MSLMFKLTIFIFIIGMALTSSTQWIDGDQVLCTLSSIAKHKTFTHFKIVYNFISFHFIWNISLACALSLSSFFATDTSCVDLWFLFLQKFAIPSYVLSTLAFVAFRLIFVAVVVLLSSSRRHLAVTLFGFVYI